MTVMMDSLPTPGMRRLCRVRYIYIHYYTQAGSLLYEISDIFVSYYSKCSLTLVYFLSVIYHVATLMPNRESDRNCNDKKRHIGNDYVTIVYNDSGEEYKIGTIKVKK